MNNPRTFDSGDDQRLFDQLVDGELDDEQRRALLEKLDAVPDGWRQCAVTFMEAQELRKVLPAITSEIDSCELRDGVNVVSDSPRRTSTFRIGGLLAMAASLFLAFALGLTLRGTWAIEGETVPRIAGTFPATRPSDDTPSVHEPSASRSLPRQELPANVVPVEPSHVWRDVALVVNDGANDEEVRWPMAEGEDIDLQWLYRQPSALPQPVIEQIEQLGHEVNVVRELYSVRLRDGRQGIVPVDRVELKYVGNQTYQ